MARALGLALADLRCDAVHFLCAVILIGAIIGQFLILLGMKEGAISVLLGELRDKPSNLEISIVSAHSFAPEDVAEVAGMEGVAFAAGQNIVTTTGRLRLMRAPDGSRSFAGNYGTTGPGDPYTESGATLAEGELILSDALARRLEVIPGNSVRMLLERGPPFDGAAEPVFRIVEVLPPNLINGNFILLTGVDLDRVESYGFGYAVPGWGVADGNDPADRVNAFEKIRIYAESLEALPALVRRIEDTLDVRTTSREGDVRTILTLESNLNAALAFILGVGAVGLFFVLAAHFWSAVRRKRLSWSMLSLMGATPAHMAAVPVVQALIVSLAGYAAGCALFFLTLTLIDSWFRPFLDRDESVAVLSTATLLGLGAAVVAMSAAASAAAGISVLRTDPADIIRSSQ